MGIHENIYTSISSETLSNPEAVGTDFPGVDLGDMEVLLEKSDKIGGVRDYIHGELKKLLDTKGCIENHDLLQVQLSIQDTLDAQEFEFLRKYDFSVASCRKLLDIGIDRDSDVLWYLSRGHSRKSLEVLILACTSKEQLEKIFEHHEIRYAIQDSYYQSIQDMLDLCGSVERFYIFLDNLKIASTRISSLFYEKQYSYLHRTISLCQTIEDFYFLISNERIQSSIMRPSSHDLYLRIASLCENHIHLLQAVKGDIFWGLFSEQNKNMRILDLCKDFDDLKQMISCREISFLKLEVLELIVEFTKNMKNASIIFQDTDVMDILIGIYNDALQVIFALKPTVQEFCDFVKTPNVGDMIISTHNIKNLNYVLDLYQVKTLTELEKIFLIPEVSDRVLDSQEEIFDVLCRFYKITTPGEFEVLCENKILESMFSFDFYDTTNFMLKFYQVTTSKELEKFAQNKIVQSICNGISHENLELFCEMYSLTTPEAFEKAFYLGNIEEILTHSSTGNLELIFLLFDDVGDVGQIQVGENGKDFLENTPSDKFQFLIEYYKISNTSGVQKLLGNVNAWCLESRSTESMNVLRLIVEKYPSFSDFAVLSHYEFSIKIFHISQVENLKILLSFCNGTDDVNFLFNNQSYIDICAFTNHDDLVFLCEVFQPGDIYGLLEILSQESVTSIDSMGDTLREMCQGISREEKYDLLSRKTYNSQKFFHQDPGEYLFNVESRGSNFFDQLQVKMKKSPDTDLEDILQQIVEKIFYKRMKKRDTYDNIVREENARKINAIHNLDETDDDLVKAVKHLKLDNKKHELAIYLRYEHQVDYPEIAEALIRFAKMYIDQGYSRYFSSIRIIPRYKERKPSSGLFDENTKFYPVEDNDFMAAMYTYATPVFLSHSSNQHPFKAPAIASAGMSADTDVDVHSKIELEQGRKPHNEKFSKTSNIRTILEEFSKDLKNVEKRIDQFIAKTSTEEEDLVF